MAYGRRAPSPQYNRDINHRNGGAAAFRWVHQWRFLCVLVVVTFLTARYTEMGVVRRLNIDDVKYYTLSTNTYYRSLNGDNDYLNNINATSTTNNNNNHIATLRAMSKTAYWNARNVSAAATSSLTFWKRSSRGNNEQLVDDTTKSSYGYYHPFELELMEAEAEAQAQEALTNLRVGMTESTKTKKNNSNNPPGQKNQQQQKQQKQQQKQPPNQQPKSDGQNNEQSPQLTKEIRQPQQEQSQQQQEQEQEQSQQEQSQQEQPVQPLEEQPQQVAQQQSQLQEESPKLLFRITQPLNNSTNDASSSSLFVLLAPPRSGADYVTNTLDQSNDVCASGDFTTAIMFPSSMPWIPNTNIAKGCTYAFVRDSIAELTADAPQQQDQAWVPPRCQPDYDSTSDELRVHLERFCNIIQSLQGDYSSAAVSRLVVRAFDQHDMNLLPCQCPTTTKVRGLRILSDWINPLSLNTTIAQGSKVIRLTRQNYFERYMSMEVARVSQHWSIHTAAEKATQIETFVQQSQNNYTVDINWMLFQFETMKSMDAETDAWIEKNGGETLWVDYEQIRDDPVTAFTKMNEFLGTNRDSNADEDSRVSVERRIQSMTDELGSFSSYTGQALLSHIANADQVREALSANGYGAFVGLASNAYLPIQHIIYARNTVHPPFSRKGIQVTVLNEGLTDSSAQDNDTDGPSAKFQAALPTLRSMSPESIVVLSEGHAGTINQHIRSLSTLYRELSQLRAIIHERAQAHPGAIIVSASEDCCSRAQKKTPPGQFFDRGNSGERNQRTCRGNACRNENNANNNNADLWMTSMKDHATKYSKSGAVYVDASFVAGTAKDMIRFIETLDILPWEDDRAVLADYMLRHPDKLLLDYDRQLFAPRFDGVTGKMDVTCDTHKNHKVNYATRDTPLFLHSARHKNCRLTHPPARYPVWDDAAGIELSPILNHVEDLIVRDHSMNDVDRHFDREIFYIMDKNGIWGTEVNRDIYRVLPTEEFLRMAHSEMMSQSNNNNNNGVASSSTRWSALTRTMQTSGFPHWAWYGDWKHCAHHNKGDASIPLFTTCAATSCKYSFPTPSYMSIIDAQPNTAHWYNVFGRFDIDYPWQSKIRKVVWRGALSENDPKKVFDSQRWRLCKMVHELSDSNQRDMFDVGLTTIPEFLTAQMDIDGSLVGGVVKGIGAMNDFQKYTAVLDMDGNSWSSRFRTMLCYNSVAIKVEPEYVDYFFTDLIPWKHYIPVKNDLSDLLTNVAFVLNPANDGVVREIIAAANLWCAERSTHQGLVYDVLDTWERYVQLLDHADPNWTTMWDTKKQDLLSSTSNIPLVQLQ